MTARAGRWSRRTGAGPGGDPRRRVGDHLPRAVEHASTPVPIDRASGRAGGARNLPASAAGGTRIRILDIPPDDGTVAALPREAVRALFEAIGAGHALAENPPHPLMHRTETIDTASCSKASSS